MLLGSLASGPLNICVKNSYSSIAITQDMTRSSHITTRGSSRTNERDTMNMHGIKYRLEKTVASAYR